MLQLDHIAMPAVPAGKADDAVGDRPDRRAIGRAIIGTLVHPRIAEQWMQPPAEATGLARIGNRRHEAGTPFSDTGCIIPPAAPVARHVPLDHARGAVASVEPDIQQFAITDFTGGRAILLDDQVEAVVRVDILHGDMGGQRADIGLYWPRWCSRGPRRGVQAVAHPAFDAQGTRIHGNRQALHH